MKVVSRFFACNTSQLLLKKWLLENFTEAQQNKIEGSQIVVKVIKAALTFYLLLRSDQTALIAQSNWSHCFWLLTGNCSMWKLAWDTARVVHLQQVKLFTIN